MTNKERFQALCAQQIHRDGLASLMSWLEASDFYEAPASTRFHGSYPGGLVEHSLHVYDELNRLRKAYPEVPMSDETAAIISLFHDLCKVNMYLPEKRNRKNKDGVWEQYDAYSIQEIDIRIEQVRVPGADLSEAHARGGGGHQLPHGCLRRGPVRGEIL